MKPKKPYKQEVSFKNGSNIPPHSEELEQSVLGEMILERNGLIDGMGAIRSQDVFFKHSHQLVFQAISELYSEGLPVDMRTVVEQLRKKGNLDLAGGSFAVADLCSKVSSASNIEYHARKLAEYKIQRSLIETFGIIAKKAYDGNDCFELLDEANKKIQAMEDEVISGIILTAPELAKDCVLELAERAKNKGCLGIPTGITELDRMTGGFLPSDLIIIAGRPAMGKTAVLGKCAATAAMSKNPVGIFSLEMTAKQIISRMICAEASVDIQAVTKGLVNAEEQNQYSAKAGVISNLPIFIDQSSNSTITELRANARRFIRDKKAKILFVDYLQLMKGEGDGNREQEVASITRGLKAIAKDANIPVVALAQLNRSSETRGGDKKPQLSDLRESGAIEQDADVVIFLYRPEYYGIKAYEDNTSTENVLELIVAKHRNGSTGTAKARFIGRYMQILDPYAPPTGGNFIPMPAREPDFPKSEYNAFNPAPERPKPLDDLPF